MQTLSIAMPYTNQISLNNIVRIGVRSPIYNCYGFSLRPRLRLSDTDIGIYHNGADYAHWPECPAIPGPFPLYVQVYFKDKTTVFQEVTARRAYTWGKAIDHVDVGIFLPLDAAQKIIGVPPTSGMPNFAGATAFSFMYDCDVFETVGDLVRFNTSNDCDQESIIPIYAAAVDGSYGPDQCICCIPAATIALAETAFIWHPLNCFGIPYNVAQLTPGTGGDYFNAGPFYVFPQYKRIKIVLGGEAQDVQLFRFNALGVLAASSAEIWVEETDYAAGDWMASNPTLVAEGITWTSTLVVELDPSDFYGEWLQLVAPNNANATNSDNCFLISAQGVAAQ